MHRFRRFLPMFYPVPDEELVKILKDRRHGGRRDWPVEAMLNAFYACLVLQFRSAASLRRNLGNNPTLMRIWGFELKPNPENKIRVPSKSAFSQHGNPRSNTRIRRSGRHSCCNQPRLLENFTVKCFPTGQTRQNRTLEICVLSV